MKPIDRDNAVTYLGRTNTTRNMRTFGIRQRDRRSHVAIIGKTGTGKSALLQNIVCQDILAGRGGALLDPHGDLVRAVFNCLPEPYRQNLVIFDAGDPSLRYDDIIQVIDAAKGAGVEKVGIVTMGMRNEANGTAAPAKGGN